MGKIMKFLFEDMGAEALFCGFYGVIIIFMTTLQENPPEYLLGFIALLYFMSRLHQVLDKEELLKEIKKEKQKNETNK
ncbi:MAG: hypothetical protein ACOCT9_02310 [archaeon]